MVLLFGLNCAYEEFLKLMDDIFKDHEEINCYFDDNSLYSATLEEHCNLLCQILTEAKETNLKCNIKKTQFAQTSVNSLCHMLSDIGIKTDSKKIN